MARKKLNQTTGFKIKTIVTTIMEIIKIKTIIIIRKRLVIIIRKRIII